MKAEEIVSNVFDRYFECVGGRDEDLHEFLEREIPKRLREAGLLLEWRTDVENAPADEQIIAYDGYSVRSVEHLHDNLWYEAGSAGFVPDRFAIIKPPEQTND